MCGIGGIVRITPPGGAHAPIPERWLDALHQRIIHRGPDGHGTYRDTAQRRDGAIVEVGLVHRRLSIIDLTGGRQPMISAHGPGGSGAVGVTFNGCIYNHRDLRTELRSAGHTFETDHSDTEVLIHGWRQWSDRITDRLDGMYAAGIWDHDRAEVAIFRDRPGEKPVYYTVFDQGRAMAFSSSVRGVIDVRCLAEPGWSPELDPHAIIEWMRFGWSEGLPFRGVQELLPRQTGVFPARSGAPGLEIVHTNTLPETRSKAPRLTVDDMDRLVSDAVASRMESDVPLGCFLSGGIDSSLLAYYAKKHLGKLTTLCVRFGAEAFDESPYAAEVAAAIGSDHKVIDAHPDAAADMVRLIDSVGLPFGDSSVLPTHWVCNAAREHVKVSLAGDGGDELCFGYRRHKAWLMLQRVLPLLHLAPRKLPRMLTTGRSTPARFLRFVETVRNMGYRSMLSWQIADIERLVPSESRRLRSSPLGPVDPANDDFDAYMPFDLMRKSDTASMLVPLEVRAPLLANRMVESCRAEPISSLMRNGELKGILRALARKHFAPSITDRPKHGFGLPVGEFFRTDFGGMRTLLNDALASPEPFGRVHGVVDIDVAEARAMIDEHTSGSREHAARLFMLLGLALWAKTLP